MLSLAREFRKLNSEQQTAVKEGGNTVVLAGPGSGKTATLVVKVAYLLFRDHSTTPWTCLHYVQQRHSPRI